MFSALSQALSSQSTNRQQVQHKVQTSPLQTLGRCKQQFQEEDALSKQVQQNRNVPTWKPLSGLRNTKEKSSKEKFKSENRWVQPKTMLLKQLQPNDAIRRGQRLPTEIAIAIDAQSEIASSVGTKIRLKE
jgi:ribosomal protein L39E